MTKRTRVQLQLDEPQKRRLSTSPVAVRLRTRRALLRLGDDVRDLAGYVGAVYLDPSTCTAENVTGLAEIAERVAAELRKHAAALAGSK